MRKSIILSGIILIIFFQAFGQFPNAAFSLPDTVCVKESFSITNSSTNSSKYTWDMCAGDLLESPNKPQTTTLSGGSYSIAFKLAYDDSTKLWYGFSPSNAGNLNQLIIAVFNNGLDNSPDYTIKTFPSDTYFNPSFIELYKENGEWYAFINSVDKSLIYRLYFGESLQSTPTLKVIKTPSPGGKMRGFTLEQDNDSLFIMLSGKDSDTLRVLAFEGSITNDYVEKKYSLGLVNSGAKSYEIECVKVYDNWYGFISDESRDATNSLVRLNFGNSLWNKPSIEYINSVKNVRGIEIAHEKNNWIVFVSGGESVFRLNFGDSIPNGVKPIIDTLYTDENYNTKHLDLVNYESNNYLFFVSNSAKVVLFNMKFPDSCATYNPVLTEKDPEDIYYDKEIETIKTQYVNLEVKDDKGNVDYYYDSIIVRPELYVRFSTITNSCSDTTVFNIDSIQTPEISNSYLWDFGDGNTSNEKNPEHVYEFPGDYLVKLIVFSTNYQCSFMDTTTVNIDKATPEMYFENGYNIPPIKFTDTTKDPNNKIDYWYWDFGDGNTSYNQNPEHTYDSSGSYKVCMVVNINDCSFDTCDTIHYVARPNLDFTYSRNCKYDTIVFLNTSKYDVVNDSIKSYLWKFGDGTTSNLKDPKHFYEAEGDYEVQLIAETWKGAKDTITKNLRVFTKVTPDFNSPLIVCVNNEVVFEDNSFLDKDTITAWNWDFGNSLGISTDQDARYSYPEDGFYDVVLTVTTGSECDTSITKTVNVSKSPSVGFLYNQTCVKSEVNFTDTSVSPLGTNLIYWEWNFGNGDISLSQNTAYTFDTAGKYNVSLKVRNNAQCEGYFTYTNFRVAPLPEADFIPIYGCDNSPVSFTDKTLIDSDGLDTLKSWNWNFNDIYSESQTTSEDQNPEYMYYAPDTFMVNLLVETNYGCKDSIDKQIIINESPTSEYDFTTSCDGKTVYYTDETKTNGNSDIVYWNWDFGNGVSSTNQHPEYSYDVLGTYNVSLIVQALDGCKDTITKEIIQKEKYAIADFSVGKPCINIPFTFENKSSAVNTNIETSKWLFDGEYLITTTDAEYVFQEEKQYSVKLSVATPEGCISDVTKTITVMPNPIPEFDFTPRFGSPPLAIDVFDESTNGTSALWNYGENDEYTSDSSYVYYETGTYDIKIISISEFGCKDSTSKEVRVLSPLQDIAISDVDIKIEGEYAYLSVTLVNIGTNIIDSVFLDAYIEGGSIVQESWIGTMYANQQVNYSFKTSFNIIKGNEAKYICLTANLPSYVSDSTDNNTNCSPIYDEYIAIDPYPNPCEGVLNIEYIIPFEDNVEIVLFDMLGNKIDIIYSDISTKGINFIEYNTSKLNVGMYMYVIYYNDSKIYKKFEVR